MMRSYEAGQESLAVKGHARGYFMHSRSTVVHSIRDGVSRQCRSQCFGSIFSICDYRAVIPRSSQAIVWGASQSLIHSLPQYSEN